MSATAARPFVAVPGAAHRWLAPSLFAVLTLTGCAAETVKPIARLAPQPDWVAHSFVSLGLSRIPLPDGEWKLLGERTGAGVINAMYPGQIDDNGIKQQVYVSLDAGGRIRSALLVATNSKSSNGFLPNQYCVYDQKQTGIYYKDIAGNVSNSADCLKIRGASTPFTDRDANAFNTRVYEAARAYGGFPMSSLQSNIAISRNLSVVNYTILDFPNGGMEQESVWKPESLGDTQRAYVMAAAARAERIRPVIAEGVGAIR